MKYRKIYRYKLFKLNVMFLTVICLSIMILNLYLINDQKKESLRRSIENGRYLCKTLAVNSYYGVWTQDFEDVQNYIDGVVSGKNIFQVFVEDTSGNILVKSSGVDKPLFDEKLIETCRSLTLRNTENVFRIYDSPMAFFRYPIKNESKNVILGFACLTLSLQDVEREYMRSTQFVIIGGIVVLCIFLLAALYWSKYMLQSLYPLIEATKLVGQGNLNTNLPHVPDDELQSLYQGFENMTMALKEKKKLEKKVFMMEQTATLGQIAGGVAHEFNNILTSIMMEADSSLSKDHNEFYRESMSNILEAGELGSSIVQNFLNIARPALPHKIIVDVEHLIISTLKLIQLEFNKLKIRIKTDLQTGVVCRLDTKQMMQVIINLCFNARDAMRSGGELTVMSCAIGDQLNIVFEDCGTGMNDEVKDHIFEPFYSTKNALSQKNNVLPGTGLGLSIVKEIIEKHGGTIVVKSEIDKGSQFIIILPLNNAS